jgi:hypothetical protein
MTTYASRRKLVSKRSNPTTARHVHQKVVSELNDPWHKTSILGLAYRIIYYSIAKFRVQSRPMQFYRI